LTGYWTPVEFCVEANAITRSPTEDLPVCRLTLPLRASFALLALTAVVPGGSRAADEDKQARAVKMFTALLDEEIKKNELQLTPAARKRLDKVIVAGVKQLAKDDFEEKKVEEAKRNL